MPSLREMSVSRHVLLKDRFQYAWENFSNFSISITGLPNLNTPDRSNSNATMQLLPCYRQKRLSEDKYPTVLYILIRFSIIGNVEQHLCTWSNPILDSTSDQERILSNKNLLFLTSNNQKNQGKTCSIERELIYTLDQTFFSLDREGSLPAPTSRAQSTSAAVRQNGK